MGDKISNVQDVIRESSAGLVPGTTDRVHGIGLKKGGRLRGTNDALERHYDDVLKQGRVKLTLPATERTT